jgi:hypothetical protein
MVVPDVGGSVLDDEIVFRVRLPVVMRYWPPSPDVPTLNPVDNADGDGSYVVSWTAEDRTEVYILEEATDSGFTGASVIYSGDSTSHAVSQRGAARRYYRVKARNGAGDKGWSNVQMVDVLWEKEPNDQPLTESNGPIAAGPTYHGAFPTAADVQDYYYFDLAAPQQVELWLNNIPPVQNYDLVLRNQNLAIVGYSAELGSRSEYIRVDLSAGRYYIQIYHNSAGGSSQDYHLRMDY